MKTHRCLWERGLHSNAQFCVFVHSTCENMRKPSHLSHPSGANCLQSFVFPATSAALLALSVFHTSISARDFPGRSMQLCAKPLFCAQTEEDNVSGMDHTRSSLSRANSSSKHVLGGSAWANRSPWHSHRTPEPLSACLAPGHSKDLTPLGGAELWQSLHTTSQASGETCKVFGRSWTKLPQTKGC